MAYSDKPEVSAQVPGIATTRDGANAFVSRLVMQTIVDVLESQARSALLPDVVTSAILGQLSVRVTYEPLSCQMVVLGITTETSESLLMNIYSKDFKQIHSIHCLFTSSLRFM
ncbi:hypothetical protein KIN20_020271 [Parelaphostrongylus tenuis]|uniref:Uncharacterized protein n=1 Tax=Parelaphostrongylus tenuis TaxID=148309 RepID=A0AAD5N9M1_PARTN|nr:hypothetical protein KIN20_020271 [Parelaphostrongylus tenuis]